MTNEQAMEIVEKAIAVEANRIGRDGGLTDYARGAALSALSNLREQLANVLSVPVAIPEEPQNVEVPVGSVVATEPTPTKRGRK